MSVRPKPLIGVVASEAEIAWDEWRTAAVFAPSDYVDAIHASGGLSMILPPRVDAAQMLGRLDGLVLTGGPDLDASHYGEPPHERTSASSPERDAAELEFVAVALANELPLLAICRGMEVLNVSLGGTLCQHLPDRVGHDEHQLRPDVFTQHEVRMVGRWNGGERRRLVHSHHHQAVERLADDLVPWAWAPDGTIEAVRHARADSVVGVQWHPEAGDDLTLFADLIEASRSSTAARAEAAATP